MEKVFNSPARQTARDGRHSQVIDADDLREALQRVRLPSTDEMVDELLGQYDKDGNALVDYTEFQSYVRSKERAFFQAFKSLDTDKSGFLSEDEIRTGLRRMGINAKRRDVRRMIQLVDANNDDEVDINEFRRFAVLLPSALLRTNIGWAWFESAIEEFSFAAPSSERWKSLLVGGLAGGVGRTAVAPLERVRSMVMTGASGGNAGVGLWKSLGTIIQVEGIAGLFRGNTTGVMKMFPAKAIQFAVYDEIKHALVQKSSKTSQRPTENNSVRLVAGAMAGAVSQLVLHPLDLAKLRQSLGMQGNAFSIGRSVARTEGLPGLYRGLGAKLLDSVTSTALGFLVYDLGKALFRKTYKRKPRPAESAVIGALSSSVSITAMLPVQVVSKRLMANGSAGVKSYSNAAHAFASIARDEGLGAFFKGARLTYAKMMPQLAFTFFVYEFLAHRWALGGLRRYRE